DRAIIWAYDDGAELGRVFLPELVEREGRLRRVAALVAATRVGANPRLLLILDRQNAIADRIALERQVHDAARALAGDNLEMKGFPANHDPERDECAEATAARRKRNRAWQL